MLDAIFDLQNKVEKLELVKLKMKHQNLEEKNKKTESTLNNQGGGGVFHKDPKLNLRYL